MNERIHELMKLSGAWDYFNSDDDKSALMDRKALENFAKLIVRECSEEIQSSTNELSDEYHVGFNTGLVLASKIIEQHFGVK